MGNNYTGWSCIHCGEEVDGPVNDHERQVVVGEDEGEVWINPDAPLPTWKPQEPRKAGPRPWRPMGERPPRKGLDE